MSVDFLISFKILMKIKILFNTNTQFHSKCINVILKGFEKIFTLKYHFQEGVSVKNWMAVDRREGGVQIFDFFCRRFK